MEKHLSESEIERRVPPNSEVLNQTAAEVPLRDISTPEIQDLIDQLYRVASGRQGDAKYPTMVGLAAPQIGVSKRIVLIGVDAGGGGEKPDLREFINPVITTSSEEMEDGREGCFSTSRVCGVVSRARDVTIEAYDRTGKQFTLELSGFPARVAQHEIDHLDGIRFPDRISDDAKLHWVEEDEFGDYRLHWQNWPTHCSRDKWLSIKTGR
jgi:peptide deformylase